MNYFDSICNFFNKEANNYFVDTQKKIFNNYFESSVFMLLQDILNNKESGKYFIEIPLEELGAYETKKDYKSFISFCECILNCAGIAVYKRNKENSLPINDMGDYVYKRSRKKIFVKENYQHLIALKNYGCSNQARICDSDPKPKLLKEFEYNSKNAERCIKNYFSWLDIFINKADQKILNNITGKVLIISHGEIEKGELKNSIPFCSISLPHTKKKQVVNVSDESSKDNYLISYATPIEPFIYLTTKAKNVEDLISKNEFETIIVIGDKKFDSILTEWLDEGYFRKLIYLGTECKSSELETYYKYSISELKNIYISENDQKPNIEDFILKNLNISNQVFQKGLIENNNILPLVWQNKALDIKISEFNILLNELKDKGLQFNFSPSFIYRYISEVSEEYRDKILNSFAEKMEGSLTFHDTEEITRSTVCDLLEDKLSEALDVLSNGNTKKIESLNSLLNAVKNKDAGKLNNIHIVVPHKNDILFLCDKLKVSEDLFILDNSYKRKISSLYAKNNSKKNIFIFVSVGKETEAFLKFMDMHSILGTKILVQNNDKDNRWEIIVNRWKKNEQEILGDKTRENVTDIKYQPNIEGIKTDLNLQDFSDDDTFYNVKYSGGNQDFYKIEFENGDKVDLSGSVWCNGIVDIEDIEPENEILYYQNDEKIFEVIWTKLNPALSNIVKYSRHWIDALKELKKKPEFYSDEELHKALIKHKWNGGINSLKNYVRDNNSTQFPAKSKLRALKALCREKQLIGIDFYIHYDDVIRAKNANEGKKKLGRELSSELLSKNEISQYSGSLFSKLGKELFNESFEKCIKCGTVKSITKKK